MVTSPNIKKTSGTGKEGSDSMPAQQSASAETDEEDKTLEVPRQSVLSGLQDSAISNFENDSVAEATNERPQKRKDYRRKASKAGEH